MPESTLSYLAVVPIIAAAVAVRRALWHAHEAKEAARVFKGKVVWVTGASSGIGRALALAFAGAGAKLVLSARRQAELEAVAAECAAAVGALDVSSVAQVLPFDLAADPEVLLGKGKEAAALWGGDLVDVLVNNGGISSRGACEDTSLGVDAKLIAVDYLAQVAIAKGALGPMLKRRSGHLVVVSSVQGRLAIPFRTSYSGAKHALHGFFESLRAEVADRGVKVTMVLPGYVATSLSLNAVTGSGGSHGKMDPTTAQGMAPEVLAQRILGAIATEQDELLACDLKTKAAIIARALLPGTLAKYMQSRAKKGWKELRED